ncbi:DUF885 domain-containing protein [Psychroserpens mesophilus]|uniref:DUF885 domain-containing protein n=1 Tax=Psychroserpens mesophilus TaxID=325473 RepID=UPI003D652204
MNKKNFLIVMIGSEMKSIGFKILIIVGSISQICGSQNVEFTDIQKQFLETYTALNIPNLQVNYVQNLKSIKSTEALKEQETFFKTIKQQLSRININTLDEYQRLDYNIMNYEVGLNLERLTLEKQWDKTTYLDDSKSVYTIPNGKNWYAYLLKRWVNAEVHPDKIFQFGLEEVKTVKQEMKKLQEKSNLSEIAFNRHLKDASFFYDTLNDVEDAFNNIKLEVAKEASDIFPYIKDISDVNIAEGSNSSLAQVPAYYSNGTFYFNHFDKPFNKRQIDWIYIHEGIPGHHYQVMVNDIVKRTDIQELFWYSGFVEGWGAYVEYLGKDLSVYKTIYNEYGKWEWDLIRSVRVVLDVGINYYGWSDKKAINFWKNHIRDQHDIGLREIKRMKRWPAQVVTYKYGSNVFLKLLNSAKAKENFDYKVFHKNLLKYGDIPMSLFDNSVKNF